MEVMLVLLAVTILFGGLILGIVNVSAISGLRRTLEQQRVEIQALKRAQAATVPAPAPAMPPVAERAPEAALVTPPAPQAPRPPVQDMPITAPPPTAAKPSAPPKVAAHRTLERQFGGRAFVWLGGVALALAGFFLVKYSIDTGLLTERVRVVLGVLFGLALLAGSHEVRRREKIADGVRIAQALAGAGIADLYGSLFAATTLYHLLPSWLGFALMAVVTASALLLSLRHGAPIAALGLIGGYATPMLIQGEPNAPVLFGYLYLVFGGLAVVIRRQNWNWLAIPAALVAFAWVILWLFEGLAAHDSTWLSLFLLGLAATSAVAGGNAPVGKRFERQFWLRHLAPVGSLVLMASVAYAANFGALEWGMFGLFAAGAILLAWFDDKTYVFAPWLALAASMAMLLGWWSAPPENMTTVIVGFTVLFAIGGQVLITRSTNPLSWAGQSAAALLGYFLIAYRWLNDPTHASLGDQADMLWAAIAAAGAAALTFAATRAVVAHAEVQLRHRLQAIYAAVAAALLAIGFAILLHQEFLVFAIAVQVLALCWINTRVDIPALRLIAMALSGLFVFLLLPDLTLLMGSFAQLGPVPLDIPHRITSLLFRYGLPSAMFAAASLLVRRQRDDEFVKALELGAIGLFTVMTYRLVELGFIGHAEEAGLFARSVFTTLLLLLSLGAFRVATRFHRIAALWGGSALAGLALARVVGLELVVFNPLWTHELVGPWPLLNGLLLAYALPAAAGLIIGRELEGHTNLPFALGAKIAAYALAFVFVTLSVRQFYTGTYLDAKTIGSAEIYSYSAIWLLMGIALLFFAVLRKDMSMRIASLAILLLTVGKVFLYDASELTGLWRVVSFLGLGLSLLGLSWFYTRFVFVPEKPPAEA